MSETAASPLRIRIKNLIDRFVIKRWLVKSFYNKFNTVLDDKVAFLNWGYAASGNDGKLLPLDAADEFHRYPLQMYYKVASAAGIDGLSVLEVGSGRGGGADFLVRTLAPRSYVGLDLSEANIAFSNRMFARDALHFRRGNAQSLPFPDEEFDRVINVESSHCYPEPDVFLREVFRILRHGGCLLMSDFRDTADTTPPSGESRTLLLEQIRRAGFEIVEQEDITANVLTSLDLDHDRKVAGLAAMPEAQRKKMGDLVEWVLALKNGPIYKDFSEGRKCYLRFVCRKP